MGPKERIARARAAALARFRVPRAIRSPFSAVSKAVSFADPPPWTRAPFREQKMSLIKNVSGGTLTSSTTVPSYGLFNFAINQINDIADIAAVFDQYRIDWVEFLLQPGTINSNLASDLGQLVSVVDFDDSSNPSSIGNLFDYNNAVVTLGNFQHYHKFRPRIATAAYSGAFSSFANSPSQWIDMASPGVQHYGVKVGWSPTIAVLNASIFIRLHVSFRSTR